MRLKLSLLVLAIAAFSQTFGGEEAAPNTALIASLESIAVLESVPGQITVQARGMANTGGWTKPQLRKKEIKDGVCVFEFVAERPSGIVTQALTKIEASVTFPKPAEIREVQVVSKRNTKSEKLK